MADASAIDESFANILNRRRSLGQECQLRNTQRAVNHLLDDTKAFAGDRVAATGAHALAAAAIAASTQPPPGGRAAPPQHSGGATQQPATLHASNGATAERTQDLASGPSQDTDLPPSERRGRTRVETIKLQTNHLAGVLSNPDLNNSTCSRRKDVIQERQETDAQIVKNFEAVQHLTEELDQLFAEMGQQVVVLRPGQRCPMKLAPRVARTAEVRIPRVQDDGGKEMVVQISCNLDGSKHANDDVADELQSGLLPEVPFDVQVAESERQLAQGQHRAHSDAQTWHKLRVETDTGSLFVGFAAKEQAFIEVVCRIFDPAKETHSTQRAVNARQQAKATADDESDQSDEEPRRGAMTTRVGRSLEAKLKTKRQEEADRAATEDDVHKPAGGGAGRGRSTFERQSSPSESVAAMVPRCWDKQQLWRGRTIQDMVAGENDKDLAMRRLIAKMWCGPINRFFSNIPRAQGSWVHHLSADVYKKLARLLRKMAQDRQALTTVAMAGAFNFMLKRQRELQLARGRLALRQLAWYKVLFAASRFRFAMASVAQDREARRQKRQGRMIGASVADGPSKRASLFRGSGEADVICRYARTFDRRVAALARRRLPASQNAGGDATRKSENEEAKFENKNAATTDSDSQSARPRSRLLSEASADGFARRLVTLNEETRQRLARMGFHVRPTGQVQAHGPGSSGGLSARGAKWTNSSTGGARRNHDPLDVSLSEQLGRQVEFAGPPAMFDKEGFAGNASADLRDMMKEVNKRSLQVTVNPDELSLMTSSDAFPRQGRMMSSDEFKRFHFNATKTAAEDLLRSRQEQLEAQRGERHLPVKIIKRYRLRFFEEFIPDLLWLEFMQSMLLVIQGHSCFMTPHERSIFESRLRGFNESRKAALRAGGMFAPTEATLWFHPIILGLVARQQRSMVTDHGDNDLAWKASLFFSAKDGSARGAVEDVSGRDVTGHSLVSHSSPDGGEKRRLRKLAELSGPFCVSTGCQSSIQSPALDVKAQEVCLATSTSSGHPVRAFGDCTNGLPTNEKHQILRHDNRAMRVPEETVPRNLRIEYLRMKRQARAKSEGPRPGKPVEEHSDREAQKRYHLWMMRTQVPKEVQQLKEQMVPYLTSLVSPEGRGAAVATPRANDEGGHASGHESGPSDDDRSQRSGGGASPRRTTKRKAPAVQRSPFARAKANLDDCAVVANPSTGLTLFDEKECATLDDLKKEEDAAAAAVEGFSAARTPRGLRKSVLRDSGATVAGASTGSALPPGSPAAQTSVGGSMMLPQTIEEIGKLVAQSKPLETIMAIDADELGGFAQRCPAGWNSGYRLKPMSKEEIRKARIIEKCDAPSHRIMRQKQLAP
eukprot:TRINITY_DN31841_c0_g1_i2.p1 TRINITY_DN31841_c0_g1~~TRINITY_DN31841_c0_g1_i2.p1  ORF type:complete len:1347 (+),score=270.26 TRINITY_DN31841_c0_g1_i2:144-4184(+)